VPRELIDTVGREVALAESVDVARSLLAGEMTGRVVVDVRR
jgi:hypothetical protein